MTCQLTQTTRVEGGDGLTRRRRSLARAFINGGDRSARLARTGQAIFPAALGNNPVLEFAPATRSLRAISQFTDKLSLREREYVVVSGMNARMRVQRTDGSSMALEVPRKRKPPLLLGQVFVKDLREAVARHEGVAVEQVELFAGGSEEPLADSARQGRWGRLRQAAISTSGVVVAEVEVASGVDVGCLLSGEPGAGSPVCSLVCSVPRH